MKGVLLLSMPILEAQAEFAAVSVAVVVACFRD